MRPVEPLARAVEPQRESADRQYERPAHSVELERGWVPVPPRQLERPPVPGRSGPPPRKRLTLPLVVVAVIFAVIVAGIVYAVSKGLPAKYSATSSFVVSVPAQGGINDSVVTAANDVASQDAELATSTPVINAAAKALKVPASTISNAITGGTLDAQNVVQVNATASTPAQASAWAQAAGAALVSYLDSLGQGSGARFFKTANKLLAPLTVKIDQLEKKIAKESPADRVSDSAQLQTLLTEDASEAATLANDTAGTQPSLSLVPGGASASQTEPKPSEYAVIGFVVALIIALETAFLLSPRLLDRRPRT